MVKTTAAAAAVAAAAECHYQSGRFSQAAIEIQRCCNEEQSDDDMGMMIKLSRQSEGSSPSSLPCGNSSKDGIIDDREIILATDDDDYDNNNINNDYSNDTSPTHQKTHLATENDNNILRVELIALSSLAHRADLAMCQFRSSSSCTTSSAATEDDSTAVMTIGGRNNNDHITSTIHGKHNSNDMSDNIIINDTSTQSSTLDHLWTTAKQTNRDYRSALRGAAISLVNTASSNTSSNEGQYASILNAMKSTALAILMAGVAASHLYLYQCDFVDGNNDEGGSMNGQRCTNNGNAWKVLVNSAVLAADLMAARREFMSNYHDTAIDDGENDAAKEPSTTRSLLEESLGILIETLFTTATHNTMNNSNTALESERDAVAMQSFRTALKVAALACGKVILPTAVVDTEDAISRTSQQPPRKKRLKSHKVSPNATSNRNVWSANYSAHSNPILHSRERIVDALSFHYAAAKYSCDEEKLRNQRKVCLEEGRMREEHSNSGMFEKNDSLSTTGGDGGGWCAGYAWKMKHCLEGLDVASSLSSSQHFQLSSPGEDTIRSLEKMAHSSTSRFACDLLGCIYAKRGEIARALELFQSSLEYADSVDSDEESAQRRTIVNMAMCFVALGEANTPVELLLHLWMTTSSGNKSLIGARPLPVEMLLTSNSARVGAGNTAQDKSVDCRIKEKLLWMLFYASSLSQDWATCLNCTEEIMKASLSTDQEDSYTVISRVFALLQCRRPSTAQELIRNLTPTLITMRNSADNSARRLSAELLLVVAQLYNADAYLLQERSLDYTGGKDTPLNFIHRANKSLSAIVPQVDASSSLLLELQILMANNEGVALVVEGDSVGALGSFRKATQLLKSRLLNDRKGMQHLPWLLIPTYFNLSLILLRDGHLEESARSWLLARKYLPCWEKAIRGNSEALKKLRDIHTVAINRHVILMAKRRMERESAVWDQENIMEWAPPSFESTDANEEQSSLVGGVDAAQVIALDVILLRYAISFAEKKAAASFRRSAGSIGY
ncbi:hypothetical protein QTG54_007994 [Skeletonema marinoi]|uniref:Uncharacterized protein n=1 Tax=Skeletonema marinoi TaxID=267567 RepID=A0AAD8Y815_9STRA|nr:hypothetical protein QTG54_007994 [Skeletonema marinoi]